MGYKWLHGVTRGYTGYKKLQTVTGHFKRLQGLGTCREYMGL